VGAALATVRAAARTGDPGQRTARRWHSPPSQAPRPDRASSMGRRLQPPAASTPNSLPSAGSRMCVRGARRSSARRSSPRRSRRRAASMSAGPPQRRGRPLRGPTRSAGRRRRRQPRRARAMDAESGSWQARPRPEPAKPPLQRHRGTSSCARRLRDGPGWGGPSAQACAQERGPPRGRSAAAAGYRAGSGPRSGAPAALSLRLQEPRAPRSAALAQDGRAGTVTYPPMMSRPARRCLVRVPLSVHLPFPLDP